MNIFNTPDWDSNPIGDASAKELFRKNAITKTLKKKKIKKKGTFQKVETLQSNRNVPKANIKKFAPHISNNNALQKSKVSNTSNVLTKNNMVISKNTKSSFHRNDKKIVNQNKVNLTPQTTNKKKMARLKKRKKQIQNIQESAIENSVTNIKRLDKKKKKTSENKKMVLENSVHDIQDGNVKTLRAQTRKLNLIDKLSTTPIVVEMRKKKTTTLRERMLEKLKSSRFRYINEQIYNSESKDADKFFKSDPDAFFAYHEGYRQQVTKWPLNPLDIIIRSIKKMPSDYVIADFGCGDANLAQSVSQKVNSFDFVSINEHVTACDMARVPLQNECVDVVVFCLSLMGNNIKEYLHEANRVLKKGGKLKIAEVESRFDTVDVFIEGVKKFGFTITWKDLSHNLFYFLDFTKNSKCKPLTKLPTIGLHPCLYKKR